MKDILHDKITVFGSGAFGTAMAYLLSKKNDNIVIYGIDEKEINDINNNHRNEKYFEKKLPDSIKATSDIEKALDKTKFILIAVPSPAVNDLTKLIAKNLKDPVYIVNLSKGFNFKDGKSLSSIIYKNIPKHLNLGVGKLSGPSYASELMNDDPTIFNFASVQRKTYDKLKKYFDIKCIKLIYTRHLEAIELLSTFKNVYAIALGINQGLGYGKNAEAFLFYQIVEELKEIMKKMNIKEEMVYSVSSIWDLYLTGTSRTSRNFNFGFLTGEANEVHKESLESGRAIEGIKSVQVMKNIVDENDMKLPIFNLLYKIIYNDHEPKNGFHNFFKTAH